MSVNVPKLGLVVAQQLAGASDEKAIEILHDLLNQRLLFQAVSELNTLLTLPEHRQHGHNALQRLGLEFAG